jgi:hypothetical protein
MIAGDLQLDLFLAIDLPSPGAVHGAAHVDQLIGIVAVGHDATKRSFEAEEMGNARSLPVIARARCGVVDLRALVDVDDDGHDVADLGGALILEEGARARLPKRGGLRLRRRLNRHGQFDRVVGRIVLRVLHRRHRGRLAR